MYPLCDVSSECENWKNKGKYIYNAMAKTDLHTAT